MSERIRSGVAAAMLVAGAAVALPASGAEWTFETIGRGIKPALALDASATSHVAYLTELMEGAVFHATNGSGAWRTTTVATGTSTGPWTST